MDGPLVNPALTSGRGGGGADYAHHIAFHPLEFSHIPTALICNKWMMSSAANDNFFKVFQLFTREKIRVQSIENRSSVHN